MSESETAYEEDLRVNPAVWGRIQTLLELLPAPVARSPLSLLDLGAAEGTWSDYLPRHWEYSGIESDPARVAAGSRRGLRGRRGRPLLLGLLPRDLRLIPSGSRVVVTAWFFLEHLRDEDLTTTLREAARILALGGLLAVSVPSAAGSFARLRPTAARLADDPSHLQHFTPRSLRRLLEAHGFRVLKVKTTGLHPERLGLPRRPWILKLWKILGLGDTFEVYAVLRERGM